MTVPAEPQLRRAPGFRDLLFFYIVTTFSLRWIANAAAAGPSALVIWIIAAGALAVAKIVGLSGALLAIGAGVYLMGRPKGRHSPCQSSCGPSGPPFGVIA